MQEGNKFKRIIFVFKILFFFISWNAKSLIKFYIEVFSNSHGYGNQYLYKEKRGILIGHWLIFWKR
jgi:hypothetical protein